MCLGTALICSCSNDSNVIDVTENQIINKADTIINYNDMFVFPSNKMKTRAAFAEEYTTETEPVEVIGCDDKKSQKQRKVSINRNTAAKLGISPGIYVVENLLCSKYIYLNGKDFWEEDSPECGYKPLPSTNGGIFESMSTERGYAEPESNTKTMQTYVVHIISNINGIRVNNVYDPCPPEKLKWEYSVSDQQ